MGGTRKVTVAIDGPAGSARARVKGVARRLGYAYVDTGAMYRAVALLGMRRAWGPPTEGVIAQAAEAGMEFRPTTRPALLRER